MDPFQDQQGIPGGQPQGAMVGPARPRQRRSWWRAVWRAGAALAVTVNLGLLVLFVVAVILAGRGYRGFQEHLVQSGPHKDKIVIIPVEGIIDGGLADRFYQQIRAAGQDKTVRALVVRVNSPGGSITGSDRLHHQISKFRTETGKPAIAFMQGVAASGGYYAAVACEKIVSEPTAITGSIGVMLGHFVFGELLEKKLGIQPVILKSGPKKDWPSSFDPPSQEQLDYLQERLIEPAYERFLDVVARGRAGVLSPQQVRLMADGGVFTAPQARDKGLIDEIGYLDDAISLAKALAGLDRARVVEYKESFSLSDLLMGVTHSRALGIGRSLWELAAPEPMYLWRPY